MPDVDNRKQTDSPEEYWKREFSPEEETGMMNAARRGAAEDAELKGLQASLDGPDATESGSDKLSNDKKPPSDGGATATAVGGNDDKGPVAEKDIKGPAGRMLKLADKIVHNKKNKKFALAAVAGAGVGGLVIAGFLSLAPLKVLSVVTNLKNDLFAVNNAATSRIDDALLKHYIISKVAPGMVKNNCTSTRVSKSCADVQGRDNMVTALYGTWRDNNIEGKLAEKYGFEIIRENTAQGSRFYLRTNKLNADLDLGLYDGRTKTLGGKAYAELGRKEVRTEYRRMMEAETFGKRVHTRFALMPTVSRKYGIRFCIQICDPVRDKVENTQDNINRWKRAKLLYGVERIFTPRTEMIGLSLECALSGFKCTEIGPADENGERLSEYEKNLRLRLADYRSKHGTNPNALEDLDKEAEKIRTAGFTEYMVKRIAGDTVGKIAGKTIPVVGWINLTAQLIEGAAVVGPALIAINYINNSTTYVQTASMALSSSDELKTGLGNAAVQGSLATMYDQDPATEQGGGGMEDTKLYQATMNGIQPQTASVFDLLSPKAYAAEPKVTEQTCDDGTPIKDKDIMCPEVPFGAQTTVGRIASTLSEWANNPAFFPFVALATLWNNTIGGIINWVADKFGELIAPLIPEEFTELIALIGQKLLKYILVTPLTLLSSGGRWFEATFMGIDTMAKLDGHIILGGSVLSPAQLAAVRAADYEDRMAAFESKPLFARMFDKEDGMSMVSRVAMSMPSGSAGVSRNFGSFLADPFGNFGRSFSAIFAVPRANALRVLPDPSGTPTHGYALDDPVFADGTDYEALWEQRDCANPDQKRIWGDKATEIDPNTGQPIHRENNPCMLIRTGISRGGGVMNAALLMPDASGVPGTGTATPPAGGGGLAGNLPQGTPQQLAQQIIAFPPSQLRYDFPFLKAQINGIATGTGSCHINPVILQVILWAVQNHAMMGISSLNRHCSGDTVKANDFHSRQGGGHAVDFNWIGGVHATGGVNATDKAFLNALLPLLPAGSGIGQSDCRARGGASIVMPAGVIQFPDDCSHIHLQVPVQ